MTGMGLTASNGGNLEVRAVEALSHYRIAAPRCRGLALPLRKFRQTKIYTDTSKPARTAATERATVSRPSSLA